MDSDMSSEEFLLLRHRECEAVIASLRDHHGQLHAIAALLERSLARSGTLYLCGNGGSATDAQHYASEFVGRFLQNRKPLSAIALTENTALLTAIGNDFDFADLFARQVQAHAGPGDCVLGISTSGTSVNVLRALLAAREVGACTIGFTGADGHQLSACCDACLMVPSRQTPRIQEAHLLSWHLICDLIERRLMVPARPPAA